MNTLKPVDEFVYDCMEDGVYDREDILQLDRTHTKEVLIERLRALEAPDCKDDNCEYLHDGYFQALDQAIALVEEVYKSE